MPNALIVDSDPETGRVLQQKARSIYDGATMNYSLAATDDEALALIAGGTVFDIALVSIDSPAISGMSLFSKIEERSFRVPRIALASAADLMGIRRAMNEGATDFLLKPLVIDDFKTTVERVLADVERRRRNWRERSEYFSLKREVDIAVDIQKRILPQDFPGIEGYGVHAATWPAKIMGGDFYDVFRLEGGRIGMVMADVSGKGIPAAFYMAVAHTLLRSVAQSGAEPAICLQQVNDLLCEYHIPGMFVSALYGVLDPAKHTFTFSNAGHQPPYRRAADGSLATYAGGEGTVLGIMPEMQFGQESVKLAPEEFIFMFTDGVTDAFNAERQPFSEERLEKCLTQGKFRAARRIVETVEASVRSHTGDAEQNDDVTAMVVRRN
jgi:sigma-B regulation protein RsbU (phosphoserine phosphatase)